MPARTLTHHKVNPYKKDIKEQNLIVFTPNGYKLNILVTAITPAALRCFIILLSRLDIDGSASASLIDLRKMTGSPAPKLSRALGELVRADLIKKRANGLYWVSPDVARKLSIQV